MMTKTKTSHLIIDAAPCGFDDTKPQEPVSAQPGAEQLTRGRLQKRRRQLEKTRSPTLSHNRFSVLIDDSPRPSTANVLKEPADVGPGGIYSSRQRSIFPYYIHADIYHYAHPGAYPPHGGSPPPSHTLEPAANNISAFLIPEYMITFLSMTALTAYTLHLLF
jgi:hypothetical protein